MQLIKPDIKGYRVINYTNKDGIQISGREYHFSWESDNVIGLSCASAFFSDREMNGSVFDVGDTFTLAYDPYSKKRFSFLPV